MKQFVKTILSVFRQTSSSPAAAGDSGVILAVVLILLGVITALVLHAQTLAYSCLNLENKKLLRTQLRATAGDEVWRALNVLAADQNFLIDHTNEDWAAAMDMRRPNGIKTTTMIVDENRFVDANLLAVVSSSEQWRPSTAVIRDLLANENSPARNAIRRGEIAGGLVRTGQAFNPEMQTEIIRDWVDKNSDGRYEKEYYRRLSEQVEIANSPMADREELFWLLNVKSNAAARSTALAVLPAQEPRLEPVNVNTAGREALLAILGANNTGLVERIIRLRNAAPLLALDQILDPLTRQRCAAYLSVRSSFFSIYAEAALGPATEAVYCLARRDQTGNIQIMRWVEY